MDGFFGCGHLGSDGGDDFAGFVEVDSHVFQGGDKGGGDEDMRSDGNEAN